MALVEVQTFRGKQQVRVCEHCMAVCIPKGRYCSGRCAREAAERELHSRRVFVNGTWLWKCEILGCDQPELAQGHCHHHCATCPRCNEGPCNGLVDEPICNVCIWEFAPERDEYSADAEIDW